MSNQWSTKNGRTSKRGLFVDGIWHCDCESRLPADKFQVKNGGKNHGRWFYTCQRSQPKRCGFFLWSDDAKIREEAAVLNNSRSEPQLNQAAQFHAMPSRRPQTPKTPMKQSKITPITPTSRPRVLKSPARSPAYKHSDDHHTENLTDIDESFDWSSSADEALLAAVNDFEESPSKAARTPAITSPGKRLIHETKVAGSKDHPPDSDTSATVDGDVFMTPSTSTNPPSTVSALLSPQLTPALPRTRISEDMHEPPPPVSDLAQQALDILAPVKSAVPAAIEQKLVDLLNQHHLRAQGIAKGRDIVRLAVHQKDKSIAELQSRITTLEAERQTSRTVIAALKNDIATSPKKPRRPKPD